VLPRLFDSERATVFVAEPGAERIRALETDLIRRALAQTGGRPSAAAALLGITRQGLHKKLRRLRLQADRPDNG
jgi:transcriptional regulator of acetoin/glycerol metabolism